MNQEVLYECLAILNSFLIETTAESEKYEQMQYFGLQTKLEQIFGADSGKVVEMALRLTRNIIRR